MDEAGIQKRKEANDICMLWYIQTTTEIQRKHSTAATSATLLVNQRKGDVNGTDSSMLQHHSITVFFTSVLTLIMMYLLALSYLQEDENSFRGLPQSDIHTFLGNTKSGEFSSFPNTPYGTLPIFSHQREE
ncbi:hypothetical protein P7K49_009513 [Saguinus oedipus]|uniref:Uncharacterized protein n=1 Tax=Saguinus oedipus TaxID=9490 RepID=A0ABQ9VKK2_SAGOE|nr:hypothetical protein P7K49_009513 [Saguinus oedipus]